MISGLGACVQGCKPRQVVTDTCSGLLPVMASHSCFCKQLASVYVNSTLGHSITHLMCSATAFRGGKQRAYLTCEFVFVGLQIMGWRPSTPNEVNWTWLAAHSIPCGM